MGTVDWLGKIGKTRMSMGQRWKQKCPKDGLQREHWLLWDGDSESGWKGNGGRGKGGERISFLRGEVK